MGLSLGLRTQGLESTVAREEQNFSFSLIWGGFPKIRVPS